MVTGELKVLRKEGEISEPIAQLTLQNTSVRYNHWMSLGCNQCMSWLKKRTEYFYKPYFLRRLVYFYFGFRTLLTFLSCSVPPSSFLSVPFSLPHNFPSNNMPLGRLVTSLIFIITSWFWHYAPNPEHFKSSAYSCMSNTSLLQALYWNPLDQRTCQTVLVVALNYIIIYFSFMSQTNIFY